MTLKQKILHILKKPRDVYYYLQGNFRYWAYYNRPKLMSSHIREQIEWRIEGWMDKECYESGSCKICGCVTTALQMANKSCDKPCYPPIMSRNVWRVFKQGGAWRDYKTGKIWLLKSGKLFLYTENTYSYVQVN